MNHVIASIFISFGISAAVCPLLIPFLHKLKFGQQVRDDGPSAHLKKAGTPTMGGIAFLLAITVTALIFLPAYPLMLPLLLMTLGFGLIGFLDDYLKIAKKKSEGLNPKQKFGCQLVLTAVFCWYLMAHVGTSIYIPFTSREWNLGWLYIPFSFIVILGTDNGVNFTDGLDGLCSSVTVVTALFFAMAALKLGTGIAPFAGAVAGSLLGFLLFNVYPARVFMGDTGSLALGAFVSSAALLLRQPLMILMIGFIYLVEVISVMIQIAYFKKTHGKRFFRMAPIHHHFELGGWSETRVVAVFTIITMLLCLLGWTAL